MSRHGWDGILLKVLGGAAPRWGEEVMIQPQEKWTAPRLSDEELEHYGELYFSHGIREAGVEFENFLGNPEYYLARYPVKDGQRDGGDNGKTRRGLLQRLGLRPASRTQSG